MTGYYRCRLMALQGDEHGSVAMLFGLTSAILLAGAGIAIDYSRWQLQRTEMQVVADAAALAGAVKLQSVSKGETSDELASVAESTARLYLTANRNTNADPNVIVDTQKGTVTVRFAEPANRTLSALLVSEDININVESEAVVGEAFDACVIALDPDTKIGIDLNLSGKLTAHDCAVWSNSKSQASIDANGSGTLKASITCAAGGVRNSNFDFVPDVRESCEPVIDPLADWVAPDAGACTYDHFGMPNQGKVQLKPGIYCGGLKASGTVSIALEPGLYVMRDGGLTISGGASIKGRGVSFLMTGSNSGIDLRGASAVTLSAPASGAMAGLVFAADREQQRQDSHLRGNSVFSVEGTVYLPSHDLKFAGGPAASLPENFTVLIARTITFNGASTVTIRSDYANSKIPAFAAKTAAAHARLVR